MDVPCNSHEFEFLGGPKGFGLEVTIAVQYQVYREGVLDHAVRGLHELLAVRYNQATSQNEQVVWMIHLYVQRRHIP